MTGSGEGPEICGAERPVLRRDIRFIQLFTYSFGFLVGFGWIVLTGQWITTAGSLGAALAFLLGGLLLIPVGLCYVELATTYPYPGGEFVYAYHAFGPGIAFFAGWVLLFLFVSLTAFEIVAAAWIVTVMFPELSGGPLYTAFGFQVTTGMAAVMVAGAGLITWVNYRGSRAMAGTQDVVTWILVGTTIVVIGSGIFLGRTENLLPHFRSVSEDWLLLGTLSVFITTPVWYSGINALPQALSELRSRPNPRILARLVAGMLIGSSVFYVLIIVAVAMSAESTSLKDVDFATAHATGEVLGSDLAVHLVLGAGLLGIISTWNAAHFAASRVLFALSRAHLVNDRFGLIHRRHGCPHVAVLFVGGCGLLGASGGIPMIGAIVGAGVIVVSILFVITCAAVFRLRSRNIEDSRRYRVPAYPWLPIFGVFYAGCTVVFSFVVTWSGRAPGRIPVEWLALSLWTIAGVVMWITASRHRRQISEHERGRLIRGESVASSGRFPPEENLI